MGTGTRSDTVRRDHQSHTTQSLATLTQSTAQVPRRRPPRKQTQTHCKYFKQHRYDRTMTGGSGNTTAPSAQSTERALTQPASQRRLAHAAPQRMQAPTSRHSKLSCAVNDTPGGVVRQQHHGEDVHVRARPTQHDAPSTSRHRRAATETTRHVTITAKKSSYQAARQPHAHAPPAFDSSAMALLQRTTVTTQPTQ